MFRFDYDSSGFNLDGWQLTASNVRHEPSIVYCGIYIPLSDDEHQMVRDSLENALASTDVIVTQLLRYHMPLLYFVCNHLIYLFVFVGN